MTCGCACVCVCVLYVLLNRLVMCFDERKCCFILTSSSLKSAVPYHSWKLFIIIIFIFFIFYSTQLKTPTRRLTALLPKRTRRNTLGERSRKSENKRHHHLSPPPLFSPLPAITSHRSWFSLSLSRAHPFLDHNQESEFNGQNSYFHLSN